MVKFAEMMGTGGEFRAVLENKLKNFREGSDYYTYSETSGRARRKHYVICSERPITTLQEVDWKNLEGFKSIEVGNEISSKPSDEQIKFVVETLTDEWVPYQTDKPNFQSSTSGSWVIPKDMAERRDEMNKRKVEMEKRKIEFEGKLRDQGFSRGSQTQRFESSSGKAEENFQSCVIKHCSNCNADSEVFPENKFCQYCGSLLAESRFKEASVTKKNLNNNHKGGGSGGNFSTLYGGIVGGSLLSVLFLLGILTK